MLSTEFVEINLEELHDTAVRMKEERWNFVETHVVYTEEQLYDIYYAFYKDKLLRNYVVRGVERDEPVPTITDVYLAAFVFENEARELFGVNQNEIAIDFGGNLYQLAETEPMTFVSPVQKAEKEKMKKAALAKEARARKMKAAAEAKAKAEAQAATDKPATAKEGE